MATTSTTLSAAITSTAARHIYLASVTGVVAQTTSLLVDQEIMLVGSVEGKVALCVRGCSGTQAATHLTGATVYVLTAADFANSALGKGAPSFTHVNPDVEGIGFPDGTRQTSAFTSAAAVSSVVVSGATSGSNTIAAPAVAGTATTTTLPGQSVTLTGEVARVDLTAQVAAISTATLFSVAAAGQYRVSWNAKITTVDGASSTLGALTITYTDPDAVARTLTAGALITAGTVATTSTANTTGTGLQGVPLILNCKAATLIQYAMAYASGTPATMTYNLHIVVEAL